MREMFKQALKFLFYGSLAVIFTLTLLFISNVMAKMYGKENQWDSLAFVGAIIGGALTLIGVQMTLRRQYQLEYRKDAAAKKRYGDAIWLFLVRHKLSLDRIEDDNFIELRDCTEDLLSNEESMISAAVGIGREMYELCNKYLGHARFINANLKSEFPPTEEHMATIVADHKKHISRIYNAIKSELQNEDLEYRTLLKRE